MVSSVYSIRKIYEILKKHLDDETINLILKDLVTVRGNKSFEETIQKLTEIHTNDSTKI